MRPYDILLKKRNGDPLTSTELEFLIGGYVRGEIEDYHMAAFCMAVFFRGLSPRETADLTLAMVNSGDRVDLSEIPGIKVDKHSTGGVGDKTTLIVVPLAASLGVPVAKMSGRGLGHTGGTVDKLESIPGFRTCLSVGEFIDAVKKAGAAVIAQTGNLVPGDKKLYALRDVTATVDSIPLIASSIMSKKIASGCDALVLDVKVGHGAFMKNIKDARELAGSMLQIGKRTGLRIAAVLSSMDQPLGTAVGNALEVKEAVATLKGNGPADLEELCLEVAAQMVFLARGGTREEIMERLKLELNQGTALEKFREMVSTQGGDPRFIEDESVLPCAGFSKEVTAGQKGYVRSIQADQMGIAAMLLGAGRVKKDDSIDPSAGLILHKKVGDYVEEKDTIVTLYYNNGQPAGAAEELVRKSFKIGEEKPAPGKLVLEVINQ